ncbi:glycosyltransferase family 39 protein [bacterium]|nr:glycosyltransferase family 39 protein [candidate division CSSED10-310 bacterium]
MSPDHDTRDSAAGKVHAGFPLFMTLIVMLFILRGIQIQCLYPPLEGPDEYQHVAYLIYLAEHHRLPVYGESFVPKSLYPDLVANPHCAYDWEQTRWIGCRQYSDFYDSPQRIESSPDIILYEAQHPPLYYLVFAPMFRYLENRSGFRAAVYTLRIVNIITAAIALAFLAYPAVAVFNDKRTARGAILAVSLSPMFLINASRITNDALMLLFASVSFFLLLKLHQGRHQVMRSVLVGLLAGLAIQTKMIALCLPPLILWYVFFLALRGILSWRRSIGCAAAAFAACVLVCVPYGAFSLRHYETLIPSQMTIMQDIACEPGLLMDKVESSHILDFFLGILVRDNLWISGWSFLAPHKMLIVIYFLLIFIPSFGIFKHLYKAARRRAGFGQIISPPVALFATLVASSFSLTYLNMLGNILTYGFINIPPYYVMIAYPALIICVFACSRAFGSVILTMNISCLAVIFYVTELHSLLLVGVPHWADSRNVAVIFRRLSAVHPAFPGPVFFFPAAVAVVITIFFILVHLIFGKEPRQDCRS